MTEWEWFKVVLGVLFPLLIAHGVWATVTIMRLRQIVEGADGKNGLKSTVYDLDAWRFGKPPYDTEGRTLDVETRCRHEAKNVTQAMISKVEHEAVERRKMPRRNA